MATLAIPLSVMFKQIPSFRLESLEQRAMDSRPADREDKMIIASDEMVNMTP